MKAVLATSLDGGVVREDKFESIQEMLEYAKSHNLEIYAAFYTHAQETEDGCFEKGVWKSRGFWVDEKGFAHQETRIVTEEDRSARHRSGGSGGS